MQYSFIINMKLDSIKEPLSLEEYYQHTTWTLFLPARLGRSFFVIYRCCTLGTKYFLFSGYAVQTVVVFSVFG
jgi:hypothetical protein